MAMRLTLRALLNWINDMLLPNDAEQIAKEVEESKIATTLLNNINEVMQFPQLPAPMVLDGTPLGNANTAAEYLDNVLAPETTPEFEKFCINSAVVLGEVASCHKILSQVLTEEPTSEVPLELKAKIKRLYGEMSAGDTLATGDGGVNLVQLGTEDGLPQVIADGSLHQNIEEQATISADGAESQPAKEKEGDEDEYEYVPSRTPWVLCTVVLAILCLILLLRGNGNSEAPAPAAGDSQATADASSTAGTEANPATEKTTDQAETAGTENPATTAGTETAATAESAEATAGTPAAAEPGTAEPVAAEPPALDVTLTESAPTESADKPAEVVDATEATAQPAESADVEKPTAEAPAVETPAVEPAEQTEEAAENPADKTADKTDTAESAESTAQPAKTTEDAEEGALDVQKPTEETGVPGETGPWANDLNVGVLTIPGQMLVRQNQKSKSNAQDAWELVDDKEAIQLKQSYVSLPGFQPKIGFLNQIQATLKDASKLSVREGSNGRIELLMRYGQFVFQTSLDGAKSIQLAIDGFDGLSLLLAPETQVAFDVHLDSENSADPASSPLVLVDVYLFDGSMELVAGKKSLKNYDAGSVVAFQLDSSMVNGGASVLPSAKPATLVPVWVVKNGSARRKDAARLRELLSQNYDSGKSLLTCLYELTNNKNKNVQGLATLCLLQLGDKNTIDDITKFVLKNPRKKQEQQVLRNAIFLSPQHARMIKKQMMESKNGELYKSLLKK